MLAIKKLNNNAVLCRDRGEMSSPWAGASVSAEIFLESSLFLKSSIRFTTLILKDKMS